MAVSVTTTGIGADVDLADAHKGDGLAGFGQWLSGVAAAYRNEDLIENQIIDRVRPGHETFLDQLVSCAITDYCASIVAFSKDNAMADSKALAESMFDDWAEEYLPTLYSSMCKRGIYNSTTAQLLANDAFAEAMKDAMKAQLDFVKAYADIIAAKGNVAVGAMNVSINSYQETHTDRKLDVYPKTGQFAQDMAVAILAYFLIGPFISREYFADN